jgi:hypothetical protein
VDRGTLFLGFNTSFQTSQPIRLTVALPGAQLANVTNHGLGSVFINPGERRCVCWGLTRARPCHACAQRWAAPHDAPSTLLLSRPPAHDSPPPPVPKVSWPHLASTSHCRPHPAVACLHAPSTRAEWLSRQPGECEGLRGSKDARQLPVVFSTTLAARA